MVVTYDVAQQKYTARANIDKGEQSQDSVFSSESEGIFIIADGLGAYPKSGEGSRLAVNAAVECLRRIPPGSKSPIEVICSAMNAANSAIYGINLVRDHTGEERVAKIARTTFDLVLLLDKLYIAHSGDSRVYAFGRNDPQGKPMLEQLTKDHSSEEGMLHMLGASKTIEQGKDYDFIEKPLEDYKKILLVTDGVYKNIDGNFLHSYLADQDLLKNAKDTLNAIITFAINPGKSVQDILREDDASGILIVRNEVENASE
jgi:serine/threonine protein phosphatase PrpC